MSANAVAVISAQRHGTQQASTAEPFGSTIINSRTVKNALPHLYVEHIKDKFLIATNKILAVKNEIIENCLMLGEDFFHTEQLQEKIDCIKLEKSRF